MSTPKPPIHFTQPVMSFGDVVPLIDGNGVLFTLSRFRSVPNEVGAYISRSDRVGAAAIVWRGGAAFYYECGMCMGPDGYGYVTGIAAGGTTGSNLGQGTCVAIPTFVPWSTAQGYAVPPILIQGPQGLPGAPGKAGADSTVPGPAGPGTTDDHIAEIAWGKCIEYVHQWWGQSMQYLDGYHGVRNFAWDYAARVMEYAGLINAPGKPTVPKNGEDKWQDPL